MVPLLALGLVVVIAIVAMVMMRSLRPAGVPRETTKDLQGEQRREFRSYLYGLGLALVLTAVPFALVYWSVIPHSWTVFALGLFAVIQIVVHFRFFLHIDPPRQRMDDLHLILFSTLILALMGGGTIWILTNLATRMH